MSLRSWARMATRYAARRLSRVAPPAARKRSYRPQLNSHGRVMYPGTIFGMLGCSALIWNSAVADDAPIPNMPALDPETATEEDLQRMMTMMIKDSKCPSCARAMLQGPCGIHLLRLLLCYSKGEDQQNIDSCALKWGPALTTCMEKHRAYYGLDEVQSSEPESKKSSATSADNERRSTDER